MLILCTQRNSICKLQYVQEPEKIENMNDADLNFEMADGKTDIGDNNREDFSHLADFLPLPIIVCNTSGTIVYSNKAMTSYNGEEILKGSDLKNLQWKYYNQSGVLPGGTADAFSQIIQEWADGNSRIITENAYGVRRRVTITPRLSHNSGECIGFIFTFNEYDGEGELRAQVEAANFISAKAKLPIEHIYRMIEEVQDYAIIMLDRDGKIINWNKGAERIKGYSADEIIGKHFRQFYLPEDNERDLPSKLITEAIRNGRALHEGWRLRKNGTIFWGAIVITAIHDEAGNVLGFTKVTRDLTDRKASEDKIKNYSAELEFKNRELEEFAYIASHDLQEPLRKIQVFAALMKDSINSPEKTGNYLNKIISSSERMSLLIQEVLRYARMADSTEMTTVDLNTALKYAMEDYEILIKEKNAQLDVDFLPLVKGYEVQLRQLFSNLIGNSLKFASPDRRPTISITAYPAPHTDILKMPALRANLHYHKFEFSDNGLGFSEEFCGKVFKMFQRADNTREGSGIGLALCQKIVNNHHGYIKAESEIGNGTKFTFYLPAIF